MIQLYQILMHLNYLHKSQVVKNTPWTIRQDRGCILVLSDYAEQKVGYQYVFFEEMAHKSTTEKALNLR